MEGSVLMVYVLDMLPMVSKELGMLVSRQQYPGPQQWKGVLQSLLVLWVSGLIWALWWADWVCGSLRAGRGSLVLDREGPLQDVPLMMLSMGSLNWTVFIFRVILKLLGELLQGREMQCGWSRSIMGSWKVMHLVVLLKSPGLGEVGTVRASMCNCAQGWGP